MLTKRSTFMGGLLAACLYAASAGAAPAPEVLLGASVQLTGPLANTGRYHCGAISTSWPSHQSLVFTTM